MKNAAKKRKLFYQKTEHIYHRSEQEKNSWGFGQAFAILLVGD